MLHRISWPWRHMQSVALLIAIVLCYSLQSFGQEKGIQQAEEIEENSNKFVVFPLVFYAPETKWGFGGAGAYTYHWKNQNKEANPSQVQFIATYTLENQILLFAPYKLYFGDNDYFVFGELGYFRYFYRYYGIGPNTLDENEETYETNFPRFIINATKRITPKLFAGLSYHVDAYDIKKTDPNGEITTGILGSKGGVVSGLGTQLVFDSRDQIFYPTKGWYADMAWRSYEKAFGSEYNFSALELAVSRYVAISEKQVLALNFASHVTAGSTPFYHLARHGGRFARGYQRGRYRDSKMFSVNTEWRQHIKGRFSGVVFLNVGGVSSKFKDFSFEDLLPAAGFGVRFELDRINQLNLRFDYGIGKEGSEFYVTVGEAF